MPSKKCTNCNAAMRDDALLFCLVLPNVDDDVIDWQSSEICYPCLRDLSESIARWRNDEPELSEIDDLVTG